LALDRVAYREAKRREQEGAALVADGEVETESAWSFVHSGYFDGPMEVYAAGKRKDMEFAREEAAWQRAEEERDNWAGPD